MMLDTPHGAKAWASQTAEGQRRYNLPPQLLPFMVPQVRTGMRGVSLGQAALHSGDPQVDLSVAWGEHSTLLGLLQVVRDISQGAYDYFSPQIGEIGDKLGRLNQDLTTLTDSGLSAWYGDLEAVEGFMSELQTELIAAIDSAGRSRQYAAMGWTSAALVLAGLGGLYVFLRRGSRRRRR